MIFYTPKSRLLIAIASLITSVGAYSATTDYLYNPNIFRETRGVNNVGLGSGDFLQFGADVFGGSSNFSISGAFTPTGASAPTFTTSSVPCAPTSVNAAFCAAVTNYSPAKTDGSWKVEIVKGTEILVSPLPTVSTIPTTPVPYPSSVTITGNGLTPSINWSYPNGYLPDALRIAIYDRSVILANGTNDIIHSTVLNPSTTGYTIPTKLSTGLTLLPGHDYAINFQMIDTRDNGSIQSGTGNSNLLARSSSFFNFRPPEPGAPAIIQLPMVSGQTGIYEFNVANVGPSSITFIDLLTIAQN